MHRVMEPLIPQADAALRTAIEQVLRGIPRRTLADASQSLTERYRGPRTGAALVRSATDAAAYAAARLPATFAAVATTALATAALRPDFAPRTLLDVGAGSGAAAWAAGAVWPTVSELTLLDSDANMLEVGEKLRQADPRDNDGDWRWTRGDLRNAEWEPHDLVIASYALGELDPGPRMAAVQAIWAATRGVLLIVEPGTTAGFEVIRELRDGLIGAGAGLLAPCPHETTCPMSDGDWCHFSARLNRSALHRQVKNAELSYEDEKFSYLAFVRDNAERAAGRVLRHPGRQPKRVELVACSRTGLRRIVVPKSHPDYRLAKKLDWGSAIPDSML